MEFTLEQVVRLAPDDSSAAAGKKLMAAKHWSVLGVSPQAMWGICRGSADYQVRIEASSGGYACSCPSRKFPCKHVLGLMMLRAVSPGAVPQAAEPEWVTAWLEKRKERAEKKAEKEVAKEQSAEKKPADEKAKQKRSAQRDERVSAGLERLDVWLKDLVRTGLASIESKPAAFWENEAKRLVDAQAPALAARVKRLATVPRSTPDWPTRLLQELGRIKLLMEAWQRIDSLTSGLQWEVRQQLGWTVSQTELDEHGVCESDRWVVIGQVLDDEDRIRAQRSWLVGRSNGRVGLVWQFAPQNQPFGESITPGTELQASVRFYPGAAALRAKLEAREPAEAIASRIPGHSSVDAFLDQAAAVFGRSPWQTLTAGVLHDVRVTPVGDAWYAIDGRGRALNMNRRDHFKLCSLSGGNPVDLAGEWDGIEFRPLGMLSLSPSSSVREFRVL